MAIISVNYLKVERLEGVVYEGVESLLPLRVHRLGDVPRLEELVLPLHALQVGVARAW